MVINEYLVKAFKELGKPQKEIIKDLGKKQSYVSALMNGKKVVGKDIAKQLHDLYGFDEGAILIGEGEMLTINSNNTNSNNTNSYNKINGGNNEISNNKDCKQEIEILNKQIEQLKKQIQLLEKTNELQEKLINSLEK